MMRGTVLRGKTAETEDQKRRARGKYPSRDAEGGFLLSSFSSAIRLPLSMKSPGEKRLGYMARLDPGRTKAVLAFSLLLCLALLTGCQLFHSEPKPTSAPASSGGATNLDQGGYALLFDLLGDEKDVAKIRFIKHPRPGITKLLKEISRVSSEAHKQLGLFGKADKSLNLTDPRLPGGETMTRKAISKTKQKTLLSSKGKELEIQLLLTQEEAMNYGAHLAKTLALADTHPQRQLFLQKLAEQLSQLEKQVVSVLSEHYTFPEGE
jgi:hypothetical protein